MNNYYNMPHENFMNLIGLMYSYPITSSWQYQGVCNAALNSNYEVVAILSDGVVYRMIPQVINYTKE
jgi:hypothetical protein